MVQVPAPGCHTAGLLSGSLFLLPGCGGQEQSMVTGGMPSAPTTLPLTPSWDEGCWVFLCSHPLLGECQAPDPEALRYRNTTILGERQYLHSGQNAPFIKCSLPATQVQSCL